MVGGCQEPPKLITVSGTVYIDSEPLSEGTIRFVPKSGRPYSSTILENGSFQIGSSSVSNVAGVDGVPPGKYQVAVSASKIFSEESADESVQWLAPSHYADFRTSGLEVDLKTSMDNLAIELTWEGSEEEKSETVDGDSAAASDQQATTTTESDTDAENGQPKEE